MKVFIFSALTAASAIPASAKTETSSQMTCHIATICSATGDCHPASEDVTFKLTEKEVGRHGEGSYDLSYGEITTEAQNVTMLGPWIWSEGQDDMQVLSALGVGEDIGPMVWTAFPYGAEAPAGTVKFLNCEADE